MLTIFAPHGYLQCANDKPFGWSLLANTPFDLRYRPRDSHMNNGSVTYIVIHALIIQFRAFTEALPVRKTWLPNPNITQDTTSTLFLAQRWLSLEQITPPLNNTIPISL